MYAAAAGPNYKKPTLSFKSVYFRDNVANYGGAVMVASGANSLFESCRFSGNRANGAARVSGGEKKRFFS